MRRLVFVASVIVLAVIAAFPIPSNAGQIWTDANGDGLPDAPGTFVASAGDVVSVDLWIDSQSFAWTNYLLYVEWAAGCFSYVSGEYTVSGGTNFPIDTFSHPSGIGFGGFEYGLQGVTAIASLSLRAMTGGVCCVTPIIDPDNAYGVFSQLGTDTDFVLFTSNPNSCWTVASVPEACCFPDASCAFLTPEDCAAAGGTAQGRGTTCGALVCDPPLPRGACCIPDGSCTSPVTPSECITLGGVYQGNGTDCGSVNCPVSTGACCYSSGVCVSPISATECATGGGTYQGDGSSCATVVCPGPEGACCFNDATCQMLPAAACADARGDFRGEGSSCANVDCIPPEGACCLPSGSCALQTEFACVANGGMYQGDFILCQNVECQLPGECPPGTPGDAFDAPLPSWAMASALREVIVAKGPGASNRASDARAKGTDGDDISTALTIGALPFNDVGNTCGFNDDYDEVCPFTGSTSSDVVYKYTPTAFERGTFSLCNSSYDTKIYVYENTVGNLIACSDDACTDPFGNPFRSRVDCVRMVAGNTYYIVIDGYFGDCGDYCLNASLSSGCGAECAPDNCPPGSTLEGEPVCFDGYVDSYNAGCSTVPPSFRVLPYSSEIRVCGQSGTYVRDGEVYRDTDWYEMDNPVAQAVRVRLCASFDAELICVDGNSGCSVVLCSDAGVRDTYSACTYWGPPGANRFFVAPLEFFNVACGSPYELTIETGGGTNAIEPTSWGRIKGLFK
ncbi:MAG: hypothetical protein ACKVU1_11940 [bacterium]